MRRSSRLPGIEVEIAYPTYSFAGVLCTHGHYLDLHARLSGSRGDRLLTRVLWGIATGGPEDPKTVADYESTITLLTEWLYIAPPPRCRTAPTPSRTSSGPCSAPARSPQRSAYRCVASSAWPPSFATAEWGTASPDVPLPSEQHFDTVVREEAARQRREQPAPQAALPHPRQAYARYLRYAWPGTVVLIDDGEPEPRLLELLAISTR